MQLVDGRRRAGLNLYARAAGSFDGSTVQFAELFAGQAAALLGYAEQVEHLSVALQARSDIGAALGMLNGALRHRPRPSVRRPDQDLSGPERQGPGPGPTCLGGHLKSTPTRDPVETVFMTHPIVAPVGRGGRSGDRTVVVGRGGRSGRLHRCRWSRRSLCRPHRCRWSRRSLCRPHRCRWSRRSRSDRHETTRPPPAPPLLAAFRRWLRCERSEPRNQGIDRRIRCPQAGSEQTGSVGGAGLNGCHGSQPRRPGRDRHTGARRGRGCRPPPARSGPAAAPPALGRPAQLPDPQARAGGGADQQGRGPADPPRWAGHPAGLGAVLGRVSRSPWPPE